MSLDHPTNPGKVLQNTRRRKNKLPNAPIQDTSSECSGLWHSFRSWPCPSRVQLGPSSRWVEMAELLFGSVRKLVELIRLFREPRGKSNSSHQHVELGSLFLKR
jgi:hypothetical protein